MNFYSYINNNNDNFKDHVFIKPRLTDDKIRITLDAFKLLQYSNDSVYVIIDDTAKYTFSAGCIIGTDYIAVKETFVTTQVYRFNDFSELTYEDNKMFVDNKKIVDFSYANGEEVAILCSLLNNYIIDYKKQYGEFVSSLIKKGDTEFTRFIKQLPEIEDDCIFPCGRIPSKKEENVRELYHIINESNVLMIGDDTVFGSAKDGFTITDTILGVKEIFEPLLIYYWKDIKSIYVKKRVLYINDEKVAKFTSFKVKQLKILFDELNKFIVQHPDIQYPLLTKQKIYHEQQSFLSDTVPDTLIDENFSTDKFIDDFTKNESSPNDGYLLNNISLNNENRKNFFEEITFTQEDLLELINEDPQSIYKGLAQTVNTVLNAIGNKSSENEKFSAIQTSLQKEMLEIQQKIIIGASELEKNSEWEYFTIAFYGETNAGKSTLIESLRIALQEATKIEQRKKFIELLNEIKLSIEDIHDLDTKISNIKQMIDRLQANLNLLKQEKLNAINNKKIQIDQLISQLQIRKRQLSFFQKIFSIFKTWPETEEIHRIQKELQQTPEDEKIKKLEKDISDQNNSLLQIGEVVSQLEKLKMYADGTIIGDGRSDFTQQNTEYLFEPKNGNKFILIDVPGIEGNENIVKEPIAEAVQKAHAVFYMTSKATPPQTGEGDKKGTLEKIKDHLGAQTEVWTIYNKRITNPRALKEELLTEDEKESIKALDNKMVEVLQEKYRQTISLSAFPAFLALADHCIDEKDIKLRKRFLEKSSGSELLTLSLFGQFQDFLINNIVVDIKEKIRESNFNKITELLKEINRQIVNRLNSQVNPLCDEVKFEKDDLKTKLSGHQENYKKTIETQSARSIDSFIKKVREIVYNKIESSDLSDKDLQDYLKLTVEEYKENFSESLSNIFKKASNDFEQNIQNSVERAQQRLNQLTDVINNNIEEVAFDPVFVEIKTDKGVNIFGIIGSIAGAGILIWNPAGWFLATMGIISVVIGLYSSIRKMFNKEYKRAQQRKSVDENLKKIKENINTQMQESIQKVIEQYKPGLKMINDSFALTYQNCIQLQSVLQKAQDEMHTLMNTLILDKH